MGRVVGIDLGTTNSCVAIIEDGQPVVIPNTGGYKTTPSVFAVTEDGKRLVGHLAKRQAITNPRNTVHAAKRLIGRDFDSPEVENARKNVPYELVAGPNNDTRVQVAGRVYTVPEISAIVLREMKRVVEEYLGEPVQQAVITVPAYFNDAQRQTTRDAGKSAGLEVLRIINEPTAAALAHGHGRDETEVIAVFDLGGGTFDISILQMSDGVIEVLSTAGDTYLGGEDFDNLLVDHLLEVFEEKEGISLREDSMARQRLRDAQPGGVERHQNGAMLDVADGLEEPGDLLLAEHHRESLGLFGEGDVLDHPGLAQAHAVEKAQGADTLIVL